jgi:hypothetical protein
MALCLVRWLDETHINLVGTDGNAPRALTSLPLGTDLQSAVVGNPQKLAKGRPGVLRVV